MVIRSSPLSPVTLDFALKSPFLIGENGLGVGLLFPRLLSPAPDAWSFWVSDHLRLSIGLWSLTASLLRENPANAAARTSKGGQLHQPIQSLSRIAIRKVSLWWVKNQKICYSVLISFIAYHSPRVPIMLQNERHLVTCDNGRYFEGLIRISGLGRRLIWSKVVDHPVYNYLVWCLLCNSYMMSSATRSLKQQQYPAILSPDQSQPTRHCQK